MSPSIDRRHVLTGLTATAAVPPFSLARIAERRALSAAMHAALGDFLDANCVYHQTYRALPTGRMAVTPAKLRLQWMSANAGLRRAVEALMSVRSNSTEDVRTKIQVVGVFFMKESPPEAHWALAESLRWRAVINQETAAFGIAQSGSRVEEQS